MSHNCTEKFCSQSDRINALQEMFSQHIEGQSKLNDITRIVELESLLDDRNRQRNDLHSKLGRNEQVVIDLNAKMLYRDKQICELREEVASLVQLADSRLAALMKIQEFIPCIPNKS